MAKLTRRNIDTVEQALGVSLPRFYVRLLTEIGHGPVGENGQIYHPRQIRDLYEPFFDDPSQLFNPYFPFGCEHFRQELWVIDGAQDRAATIGHETVPDDWPEEDWLNTGDWMARYLTPRP